MVRAEDGIETDATLNDGEFAGVDLADLESRLGVAETPAQAALTALSAAIAAVPADDEAVAALDPAAPATVAMLNALARGAGAGARAGLAQRARRASG